MRAGWLALAALVLPVATGQAQKHLGMSVTADVAVRVYNLVGTTTVTGWDRDSIHVAAVIPRGGGTLFGGGAGRSAKLGIDGQNPSLTGLPSQLEVMVPRTARIWIKSGTATVVVRGVRGEVEVTSVTGGVAISGAPRVATIETIDGDVSLTGPMTVVRARTGAGAVAVSGARGDVSVSTVQGRVTIESDELLSGRIETVSGGVVVRTAVPPDGQLDIESHEGAVEVHLPPAVDARFELSTIKGPIIISLAGADERRYQRTARFAVGKKAGAGRGASITVRTFSGSIRVDSNPD